MERFAFDTAPARSENILTVTGRKGLRLTVPNMTRIIDRLHPPCPAGAGGIFLPGIRKSRDIILDRLLNTCYNHGNVPDMKRRF